MPLPSHIPRYTHVTQVGAILFEFHTLSKTGRFKRKTQIALLSAVTTQGHALSADGMYLVAGEGPHIVLPRPGYFPLTPAQRYLAEVPRVVAACS